MPIHNILSTAGEWLKGDGPQSQIVVSSRVRLARNLTGFPFPGHAKKNERVSVLECIKPAVESLSEMTDANSVFSQDLSALEKQVLVERHLISRDHAAKGMGSAVVMNKKQTLSIMINEEDHLRMQAIRSGLQLKNAFKLIDKVDSELGDKLDFAFHNQFGFLTACPTNVGTGMRASAMMHLPALVLSEQINQVIQAVNKVGLAVRGLYGEGTEAMGNLFQISNQTTLGEKEEDIIARLNKVIEQIILHEKNARVSLQQKKPVTLLDNVGRAYGILRYSHSMASKEALNLLSYLKLGVDLGFFPTEFQRPVDELFIETQPAHLQKSTAQKLQADERDALRATIIRSRLEKFPKPEQSATPPEPRAGTEEPEAK
jgi:protein arginine kinase